MPNPKDAVWYLRVEQDRVESVSVLTVSGRVWHQTASQLEAALATAMASATPAVIVDLSRVDYISSPGLRVLERASTRLAADGRRFVVCGPHDAVSVAFDLGGLAGILTVEPTRDAALAAVAGLEKGPGT